MLLIKHLIITIFAELQQSYKIFELNDVEIDTRMLEPNTRLLDYSKNDLKIRVPGYSMLGNGITRQYAIFTWYCVHSRTDFFNNPVRFLLLSLAQI